MTDIERLIGIIEKQRLEIELLQKDTLVDRIRVLTAELEKVKYVLNRVNRDQKTR